MSESNKQSRGDSHWLTSERIDACCDEFESAWQRGESPRIEDFLSPNLGEGRQEAIGELIRLEMDYRVHRGLGSIELADLLGRFPECESMIREIVEDHPLTIRGGSTRLENVEAQVYGPSLLDEVNVELGDRFDQGEYLISGGFHDGQGVDSESRTIGLFETELPKRFGKYELLRVVGRGGMGVVYEARQVDADRLVAIKLIRRDRLEGLAPSKIRYAFRRFQKEAKVAAGIHHPHWVTVFDVGEVGGQPYYAMQLVVGKSIAEHVRAEPLEGQAAARYILPIVDVLGVAHENEIIHRDVKPHNLLLDRHLDQALIADFGLAKLRNHEGDATCTGEVFGSPSYLSPEQAQDASRADERSDIYGIGATLYHMVTGRPPFQSTNIAQTIKQVIECDPVEPRKLVPHLDRDLETICLKCLRKEPKQRYANAAELAAELHRYLEKKPIQARPIGQLQRSWRWARRNPVTASLMTSVGVLAVTLIATLAWTALETSRLLNDSNRSLHQERIAKREMFDSLVDYVETVSSEPIMSDVGFQPLREELLDRTADHLADFTAQASSSEVDEIRAAQIWTMLAEVHFESGRSSEANACAQRAVTIADDSHTNHLAFTEAMVESKLVLARVAWEQSRASDAIDLLDSIRLGMERSSLNPVRAAQIQAQATSLACEIYLALGDLDSIEQALSHHVVDLELLRLQEDEASIRAIATVYETASQFKARRMEMEGALLAAREAVDSWKPIVERRRRNDDEQYDRKTSPSILPVDYFRQRLRVVQLTWGNRDIEQAVDEAHLLANELGEVTRRRPTALEYQIVFANTLAFLSQSQYRKGNVDEYEKLIEKLEVSVEMLESVDATRRSHRIAICNLLIQSAYVEQVAGHLDACERRLHKAYILTNSVASHDQEMTSIRLAVAAAIVATFGDQNLEWYSYEELALLLENVQQLIRERTAHVALAEQLAEFLHRSANQVGVDRVLLGMETKSEATSVGNNPCLDALTKLVVQYPESYPIRFLTACEAAHTAVVNNGLSIDERLEIFEANLPDVRKYAHLTNRLSEQHTLSIVLHDFALACVQGNEMDRAYRLTTEAEEILLHAIRSFSSQLDLHTQLASLYYLQGSIDLSCKRLRRSRERFELAASQFDSLTYDSSVFVRLNEDLIGSWMIAHFLVSRLAAGQPDESSRWMHIQKAIEVFTAAKLNGKRIEGLLPALKPLVDQARTISESNGQHKKFLALLEMIGEDVFHQLGETEFRSECARLRVQSFDTEYQQLCRSRRSEDLALLHRAGLTLWAMQTGAWNFLHGKFLRQFESTVLGLDGH